MTDRVLPLRCSCLGDHYSAHVPLTRCTQSITWMNPGEIGTSSEKRTAWIGTPLPAGRRENESLFYGIPEVGAANLWMMCWNLWRDIPKRSVPGSASMSTRSWGYGVSGTRTGDEIADALERFRVASRRVNSNGASIHKRKPAIINENSAQLNPDGWTTREHEKGCQFESTDESSRNRGRQSRRNSSMEPPPGVNPKEFAPQPVHSSPGRCRSLHAKWRKGAEP